MKTELWKPVLGFENAYEVSNSGRVRSFDRMIQRGTTPFKSWGRLLKLQADGDGYLKVALGRANQRRVHQLVAQAFLPNPFNLPELDHRDTHKINNHVSNLRWCTKAVNSAYRHASSYKTCEVRYNDDVRYWVTVKVFEGTPIMHVAREFKMSRSHVRRIAYGD